MSVRGIENQKRKRKAESAARRIFLHCRWCGTRLNVSRCDALYCSPACKMRGWRSKQP